MTSSPWSTSTWIGVEEGQLAAGGEDALFGGVVRAEVAGVAIDDGLAYFGDSGDSRVAGEVLLDGIDGRVLDVARSRKVRLACAEVRQVHAFRLQLQGRCGYGHRGRDFNPVDPVRQHLCRRRCAHAYSLSDLAGKIKPILVMVMSVEQTAYRRDPRVCLVPFASSLPGACEANHKVHKPLPLF